MVGHGEYALVADNEHPDIEGEKSRSRPSSRRNGTQALILALCVALAFTGGFIARQWMSSSAPASILETSPDCKSPTIRREWRKLSRSEKTEYIAAAQCMRKLPSALGIEGNSMYDDFPYAHSQISETIHDTAYFLPWHRYFVHLWESALQQHCNYSSHIPYWDWTLDWEDVFNAPVWDPEIGFGGCNTSAPASVGQGFCVTDGPFAGLEVLYFRKDSSQHCLSRGFQTGETLAQNTTARIRPDAVEKVLGVADYETFVEHLENGPHIALPLGIRGDWFAFTAPYDPVFYLHHTHVDKLWWNWQQRNPSERVFDFAGIADQKTGRRVSLEDALKFHGLADDVSVKDVMSTESGPFCYRY